MHCAEEMEGLLPAGKQTVDGDKTALRKRNKTKLIIIYVEKRFDVCLRSVKSSEATKSQFDLHAFT